MIRFNRQLFVQYLAGQMARSERNWPRRHCKGLKVHQFMRLSVGKGEGRSLSDCEVLWFDDLEAERVYQYQVGCFFSDLELQDLSDTRVHKKVLGEQWVV